MVLAPSDVEPPHGHISTVSVKDYDFGERLAIVTLASSALGTSPH